MNLLPVEKRNTLTIYLAGLWFGILQSMIYFTIQVYVTATYAGYFAMILAWMSGVVFMLRYKGGPAFMQSVLISVIAYYALLGISISSGIYFPVRWIILPVLIFIIAGSAGSFFREFAGKTGSDRLFFHENNGFIFGMFFGLILFIKYGVQAVYFAPGLIFLLLMDAAFGKYQLSLPLLAVISGAFFYSGFNLGGYVTSAFILLIFISFIGKKKKTRIRVFKRKGGMKNFPVRTVLFISGFNLIVLQFYITREFSNILSASELTVLIVATTYFIGFSLGYMVSGIISIRFIKVAAVILFFMHLAMFVFLKEVAAFFTLAGFSLEMMILFLAFIAFFTSSIYSVLLPKMIMLRGEKYLSSAYSWDLAGALASVIVTFILLKIAPQMMIPLYLILMLLLSSLFLESPTGKVNLILAGLFLTGVFIRYQPEIHKYGTEDYYLSRGFTFPESIFSKNSFYHTIDVIDSYGNPDKTILQSRSSFINGVLYFDYGYGNNQQFRHETSLSEFTYFLAEVPAEYLSRKLGRKLRILILGGGSMYSINRVSPWSEKTTLVDIDPVVIESAKKCWYDFNRYDEIENYEIIVDDAKHYLKTTDEKFDLIIMDISAPYTLGSALLHNVDFYKLIRENLNEEGIFSESTQSRPVSHLTRSPALKILKGVSLVYPNYAVVVGRKKPRGAHGYVYGSAKLEFSPDELFQQMKEDKMRRGVFIYLPEDDMFNLDDTVPYSLNNMEILLEDSRWIPETGRHLMEKRFNPGLYFKTVILLMKNTDFTLMEKIKGKLPGPGGVLLIIFVFLGINGLTGYFIREKYRNQKKD